MFYDSIYPYFFLLAVLHDSSHYVLWSTFVKNKFSYMQFPYKHC